MTNYSTASRLLSNRKFTELENFLISLDDKELSDLLGSAYQFDELIKLSNAIDDANLLYRMYSLCSLCGDASAVWLQARELDQNDYFLYCHLQSLIESENKYSLGVMLKQPEALELLKTEYNTGSLLSFAITKKSLHGTLVDSDAAEYKIMDKKEPALAAEPEVKPEEQAQTEEQSFKDKFRTKASELFESLQSIEYRQHLEHFLNTTAKNFLDEKFKDTASTKKSAAISISAFTAAAYVINDANPLKSAITGAFIFGAVYVAHQKYLKDKDISNSPDPV